MSGATLLFGAPPGAAEESSTIEEWSAAEERAAPGRDAVSREVRIRDLLYAPHRDAAGLFFTPWAEGNRSILRFLRWQLSANSYDRSSEPRVPTLENDGAYLRDPTQPASLTWVGHATYAVHDSGDVFLTDPIWGKRALVAPRLTPPGIPIESIPAHAFAVVSHSHYDHLDAYTVKELPDTVAWYVPLGLGKWMRKRGPRDVTELDWWESAQRGRWKITCLPSQHWSKRIELATNETLWCAWLIESSERRYFFAGDTGYFGGFSEFRRRFGEIDAALMPIGAYAPRWFMGFQHMDPAEAYRAFLDLGARLFFAMHWGTFDLTDEPIDMPPLELRESVLGAGGSLAPIRVPAIGERVLLPPRPDAPQPLSSAALGQEEAGEPTGETASRRHPEALDAPATRTSP